MPRFSEFSQLPKVPGWGMYDWQQMLGNSTDGQGTVGLGQLYQVHAMWTNTDEGFEGGDADYAALIELQDGSWATLHAGCDTTGWGCQGDYVRWRVFSSRDEAVRAGLTNESRRWLQVELPGPTDA